MPTIIGFDTETCEGPPMTVQFYSEHVPRINACIFVNGENVITKTLRHLDKHCKAGQYVLYAHNLKFDLLSIFYPLRERLVMNRGAFDFTHGEWNVNGVYGQPTFCTLYKGDVRIFIADTYSWFQSSLYQAARVVCPELPKLKFPEGLGTRQFKRSETKFIEYAMRDAVVAFHIGIEIDDMHAEFDLQQSCSVADMAQRIFTQHYIHESAPIWNTGKRIVEGAMFSYHGGKNNVINGAAPAWHSHVDAWDISSAYPNAMLDMPACSNPNLFAASRVFNNRCKSFPRHGIYCISGEVPACDWPVIFDHDFKPIRGKFENIWVPGYELNEARRAGEIKLSRVFGHTYDTDKDPVTDTGLQRFVKDFYALKQSSTSQVKRQLYKTILNSLYGKFIQMREIEPGGTDGVRWKMGPLYHPFIASLITGHTRSVMHRIEHQVSAIHTATDGVYCGMRNSPANGVFDWAPPDGIGSITSEGSDLELGLLRNKLYVMYDDKPGADGFLSYVRPNRYVIKYAKHGFQGKLKDLELALVAGDRNYTVTKPNTLKTSINRGLVANKFESHEMQLNVDAMTRHYDWS